MNAIAPAAQIEAAAELADARLLHDLRTCAALARDYDWKRIAILFAEHQFVPLQALAAACRDAVAVHRPGAIGPAQICLLADPADAHLVDHLIALFALVSS